MSVRLSCGYKKDSLATAKRCVRKPLAEGGASAPQGLTRIHPTSRARNRDCHTNTKAKVLRPAAPIQGGPRAARECEGVHNSRRYALGNLRSCSSAICSQGPGVSVSWPSAGTHVHPLAAAPVLSEVRCAKNIAWCRPTAAQLQRQSMFEAAKRRQIRLRPTEMGTFARSDAHATVFKPEALQRRARTHRFSEQRVSIQAAHILRSCWHSGPRAAHVDATRAQSGCQAGYHPGSAFRLLRPPPICCCVRCSDK